MPRARHQQRNLPPPPRLMDLAAPRFILIFILILPHQYIRNDEMMWMCCSFLLVQTSPMQRA